MRCDRETGIGKRETWARPSRERSEQAHEHGNDSRAELHHLCSCRGVRQFEPHDELEMTQQLGRRSERYAEASYELQRTSQRVALGDIGGYRDGGAADLIGEGEVSTERRSHGQEVSAMSAVLRAPPHAQLLTSLHQM